MIPQQLVRELNEALIRSHKIRRRQFSLAALNWHPPLNNPGRVRQFDPLPPEPIDGRDYFQVREAVT